MAWLEMPTRSDISAYSYKIQLEGTTYQFTFTFNDRMGKWFMAIGDNVGSTLLDPIPLAANWNLVGQIGRAHV